MDTLWSKDGYLDVVHPNKHLSVVTQGPVGLQAGVYISVAEEKHELCEEYSHRSCRFIMWSPTHISRRGLQNKNSTIYRKTARLEYKVCMRY